MSDFGTARALLADAHGARELLMSSWSQMLDARPFSSFAEITEDGTGILRVYSDWPEDLVDQINRSVLEFSRAIKDAMDEAVWVAAQIVVGYSTEDPDRVAHRMPLCAEPGEFDDLLSQDQLLGLRPDQIRILRLFQPFSGGDIAEPIGDALTRLCAVLSAPAKEQVWGVWVTPGQPEILFAQGAAKPLSLSPQPPGLLDKSFTVGTFRPESPEAVIKAWNPDVACDLVVPRGLLPSGHEDDFSRYCRALLLVARHLIEALERSIDELHLRIPNLSDAAPVVATPAWLPIIFDNDDEHAAAEEVVRNSELGMASWRDETGHLTMLRLEEGQLLGRQIPQATLLPEGESVGFATENAILRSASRWGLPDFVYQARQYAKGGSGIRELGDGTIVFGRRGISLQSKARENATDNPEREHSWLIKKAAQAGKQAAGTIRASLGQERVELVNMRNRTIHLAGNEIEWAAVVILDHPHPPDDIVIDNDVPVPTVTLLRRDWDMLWGHLRSASAVVDYVHRAATWPGAIELGAEAIRLQDMAYSDAKALPGPPTTWTTRLGGTAQSTPLIPRDPVTSCDEHGHLVFQIMLNDIARSPWPHEEEMRFMLLSLLDRFHVGRRAELGRVLLERIDRAFATPAGEFRAEHRIFLEEPHGQHLHLAFSVFSVLTENHRRMYTNWLLLRRYELLKEQDFSHDALPWSIGVLLTPRWDGSRAWDTTVIATDADIDFDPEEYEALSRAWQAP